MPNNASSKKYHKPKPFTKGDVSNEVDFILISNTTNVISP